MDPTLAELLEEHKPYFRVQEDGKVVCEINGHCFPPRLDIVKAFVQGKKYPRLRTAHEAEKALGKYEPFIVVSKNFPHMLYCALTGQLMEKSLAAVKKHMAGKRFIRAKERYMLDEIDLRAEMDLTAATDEDEDEEAAEEDDEAGPHVYLPELDISDAGDAEAGPSSSAGDAAQNGAAEGLVVKAKGGKHARDSEPPADGGKGTGKGGAKKQRHRSKGKKKGGGGDVMDVDVDLEKNVIEFDVDFGHGSGSDEEREEAAGEEAGEGGSSGQQQHKRKQQEHKEKQKQQKLKQVFKGASAGKKQKPKQKAQAASLSADDVVLGAGPAHSQPKKKNVNRPPSAKKQKA